MNDLLDSAVAAHGGLDRWNQVKSVTFDASITGAFWQLKGQGDALRDVRVAVDTTRQLVTIEAGGQAWRRLAVTFPGHIKTHARQQVFCFGPDGLLRRHDFSIDLLGGVPSQLNAAGYRDVGGIIFPATRRAYDQLSPEHPLMVAIDMTNITLS